MPPSDRKMYGPTGFRGVRKKEGKYEATCTVKGKRHHLGRFDDVLDAGVAASDFRLKHAQELEESKKRPGRGKK